jgi:hypothetical protein
MTNTISNMDDTIDSRDIIERIEELNSELETFHDEQETTLSFEYALQDRVNFPGMEEEYDEWKTLSDIAEECEGYASDWQYGEQLIRRSYFEQAMDEMVDDCYELPKDMPFWMSIKLDYDALEQDYTSVDYDGVEYLIRSV